MKKLALSIIAMACVTLVHAQSPAKIKCAAILDEPVTSVAVEKDHIIDVCLHDANLQIEKIAIGNPKDWNVDISKASNVAYIWALKSSGGSNVLVYVKGQDDARFELRLRAIPMHPQ